MRLLYFSDNVSDHNRRFVDSISGLVSKCGFSIQLPKKHQSTGCREVLIGSKLGRHCRATSLLPRLRITSANSRIG